MVKLNMQRLISFVKNHKIIVVIITFFVIGSVIAFLAINKRQPLPSQGTAWENLTPGESTKSDVVARLGEPLSESENSAAFRSQSLNRPHQAVFEEEEEKVIFLREIITAKDSKDIPTIQDQYGIPTHTLYGPESQNGFDLYVYPSQGIAYLGNPTTGDLLEIWYFQPTTIELFIENWAQDYSTSTQPGF